MSKGKEVGTAVGVLATAAGAASQTATVTTPAWVATVGAFLATPGGVVVIAGVSAIAVGAFVWKLSSTSSNTTSINPHQSSSDSLKTTNLQPITPIVQNTSGGVNVQPVTNININFFLKAKRLSYLFSVYALQSFVLASLFTYGKLIQPHAPIS